MTDGRPHARVFPGGDGGDPALDRVVVWFIQMFDVEKLGPAPAHPGKAVDSVRIAQGGEGFAEQDQGFLDGGAHPAFGGGGEVDEKEGGNAPLLAGQPDEEVFRGRQTGPEVGQRFGERVQVDVVTFFLPLDEAFLGAQHFKLPPELHEVAAVLGEGGADEGAPGRRDFLERERTPVLTKITAPKVPFIVDVDPAQGFPLFPGWGSAPSHPLAAQVHGAADVLGRDVAQIVVDFPGKGLQLPGQREKGVVDGEEAGGFSGRGWRAARTLFLLFRIDEQGLPLADFWCGRFLVFLR